MMDRCHCCTCDPELAQASAALNESDLAYLVTLIANEFPLARARIIGLAKEIAEANADPIPAVAS